MRADRVGLDIDGVVADYHTAIRNKAKAMYNSTAGKYVNRAECHVLDSMDFDFWNTILPTPYEISRINDNTEPDCLFFVTRRPPCLREVTQDWLEKHCGFSNRDTLIMGAVEKGKIAAGLYLNVFTDDDPTHAIQVARQSPTTNSYWLRRPHNKWYSQLPVMENLEAIGYHNV